MVVAIDGPAGSGKSTVARTCAESLGFLYVNSGELYRAVTFTALERLEDPSALDAVETMAEDISLEVTQDGIVVDGILRSDELHSSEVDRWVSQHSGVPRIREIVNAELRRAVGRHNLIVEGRDIATVVFPDAEIKIYLDADVETRAQRRYRQRRGAETVDASAGLEELRRTIAERDERDRKKQQGALRMAEDAVYLDTSGLTITEVCAKVLDTIQRQYHNQESQKHHGR
ncbi:MAG: (d)CMP kinase [Spirochaetaceae bacterium]